MKKIIIVLVLMLASVTMAFAATNHIQEGDVLSMTFSGVTTTSGEPVIKSTATASGAITGVALTTGAANVTVQVATKGVYDVPVQALTNPIAIGDYIYTTTAGINSSVASLTNTNTGYIFGKSLETLIVASNTQTIKVLLINR